MNDKTNDSIIIKLDGRIDSNNAQSVEQKVLGSLPNDSSVSVILDAENLEYISSAGLRVILRVKKQYPSIKIENANAEVYDIFEMTGFTDMMPVSKAYRIVSVEGCEEVGRGANGTVYRIDSDNVVKVYNNANALNEIQHEREVAKLALILGIPTAISYDVVKVGNSYGSVFELLNARSFSKILATEPEKMDWCVEEYIKMIKNIHATTVPKGKLPDMKETVVSWAEFVKEYLPKDAGDKLVELVKQVPHSDKMIHGDYHTKNLVLQNDEVLIIDMDTLAVGHPIFELASMFNSYVGYSELDHNVIKEFQGFDYTVGREFWKKSLQKYLGTTDEDVIKDVESKARIIGYTRLIRRAIRRKGLETETGKKEIAFWTENLIELLNNTDTLLFAPSVIEVSAVNTNLNEVQSFIEAHLDLLKCPVKIKTQIDIAVEEVFVNVASYAYSPDVGKVTVKVNSDKDKNVISITFIDDGKQYNPLEKEDPDVTLSAKDRAIGGLGIFMTKNIMDELSYEYKDGKNILTLKKHLKAQ